MIIGLVTFGLATYFGYIPIPQFLNPGQDPTKVQGNPVSVSITKAAFNDIRYNLDFQLKDLAEKGSFTIVEFTSKSCGICQQLNPRLSKLVNRRRDVQVVKIDLPEGPQEGTSFTATSEAEMEQKKAEMYGKIEEINKVLDRFSVCGAPHITIFDPDAKVTSKDTCNGRSGYAFLDSWLAKEGI